MKINVLLTHLIYDELYFTGKTVVVIDVLRASSTIVNALNNGAREIIPVASVEFAVKISGGLFSGQTLIGGERNTKKIDGFALGNSPLEYKPEIVSGKSIIFYTTNGSKAIVKAKFAENLFICSYLNLSAIVNHVVNLNKDFEVLCSGKPNSMSLEDTVCAGRLVSEIQKIKPDVELTDSAKASAILNKSFGKNIHNMLKQTEHGQLLLENGFDEDLQFCSKLNITEVIPCYTNNAVKNLNKKDNSSIKASA
jgi:2-phosphosulfolactate phosphatase